MKSLSFHLVLLLAASNNDASSTRKVYLLAAGLAMLGVLLLVITVWFWRNTRHDPELLGPLEVMSKRKFRSLDGGAQQKLLDDERPAGAEPMRWGLVRGDGGPEETVDLSAAGRGLLAGYDDLRDPVAAAAVAAAPSAPSVVPADPQHVSVPVVDAPVVDIIPVDTDDADAPAVVPKAADDLAPATAVESPVSSSSFDTMDIDELLRLNDVPVPSTSAPVASDVPVAAVAAVSESAEVPDEPVASTKATPLAHVADIDVPVRQEIVIVPIDHELPSASGDRFSSKVRPGSAPPVYEPIDDDLHDDDLHDDDLADDDVTRAEQRPSIDPLLRMFERNTD